MISPGNFQAERFPLRFILERWLCHLKELRSVFEGEQGGNSLHDSKGNYSACCFLLGKSDLCTSREENLLEIRRRKRRAPLTH